jgi:hypothetical protein
MTKQPDFAYLLPSPLGGLDGAKRTIGVENSPKDLRTLMIILEIEIEKLLTRRMGTHS